MIRDEVQRLYFSIEECSKVLGISRSKIRFYEKEFGLNFRRSINGKRHDRRLTVTQLGTLAGLVKLTEHLHLEAAKRSYRAGTAQAVLDILEPNHGLSLEEDLTGVPMRVL